LPYRLRDPADLGRGGSGVIEISLNQIVRDGPSREADEALAVLADVSPSLRAA